MVRFNTEEQFKFLISCIRYSNNGRIDFVEVAKECSIVSKGAAAKRYERMMKAHSIGVDMATADGSEGDGISPPKKRRKRAVDTTPSTDNTNDTTDEAAGSWTATDQTTSAATDENVAGSKAKAEKKRRGSDAPLMYRSVNDELDTVESENEDVCVSSARAFEYGNPTAGSSGITGPYIKQEIL